MAASMSEYELEGEEFLGTIGRIAGGLLGGQGEYEGEFEEEYEGEYEGEFEEEYEGEYEGEFEEEYEGEYEGEFEAEYEGEYEGEFEEEWEGEVNPIRRIYPDALMEHLGHAAAEAESEAEAEAFCAVLVPLAVRAFPRAVPAVMRATPQLIQGVARVTRTLRRRPETRPLVRTLPEIIRRTTRSMAQQVAQGQVVTPRTAVQTLARQATRVLRSPRQRRLISQRSRALDRRYHVSARRAASARPVRAAGPRRPASARPVRAAAPRRHANRTGA